MPYGAVYSGSGAVRFLYTGQEFDAEVELYDYGARWYDPRSGRFIQPDPIIQDVYNPQNLNRYAYVLNNPYKYTDESGNIPILVTGAIGAVAGGVGGFAISVISQAYVGGGNFDFSKVNYATARQAGVVGAISGGVAGLTLGVGSVAIAAYTGTSVSTGTAVALTGASHVVGGGVGQVSENLLNNDPLTQNLLDPGRIGTDALVGVTAGAGSSGVKSLFTKLGIVAKTESQIVSGTTSTSSIASTARTSGTSGLENLVNEAEKQEINHLKEVLFKDSLNRIELSRFPSLYSRTSSFYKGRGSNNRGRQSG